MINRDAISRIPKPAVSGSRDNEALQTDVMRFMAILGLCLTAIFSLLRGIPEVTEQQPALPTDALSEQQPQRVPVKVPAASPPPAAIQASTETMEKKIIANNISREKTFRQAGETFATKIPVPQVDKEQTTSHSRIADSTNIDKKGFELRFASDGTLEKMARENTVQLYALENQNAWQFQRNRLPVRSTIPKEYYEMQPQTVPEPYLNAMHIIRPDLKHKTLIWAVTLPAETRQAISRLMTNADGGDLEIQADGNVTIK